MSFYGHWLSIIWIMQVHIYPSSFCFKIRYPIWGYKIHLGTANTFLKWWLRYWKWAMLYTDCSFSVSQPLFKGGWDTENEQSIYNIAHFLYLNHHFRKVFAVPKWNLCPQMGYTISRRYSIFCLCLGQIRINFLLRPFRPKK